ncbi:CRISPR-associated endonuclease Cas3'' [Lacticaseibacillus zhaodongensis]|uniref:CRISPR-associated endonuclease Cas3'' n=1 Tax=Lacticaseibacillus zhaodongensis TaxID=2668065 RepID=UPI0012D31F5C|nr:CRISPR-associated endonuclease Cas3'' [Lacticaseibacillus zhaodongensis]
MTGSKFIAHKVVDAEGDIRWQSVVDHLVEVRDLAASFGEDMRLSHVTGLAGWLHDAGKYSDQFQDYINKDNGKRGSVNHAFAGARILEKFINEHDKSTDGNKFLLLELLGNVIMAHHNPGGPNDFLAAAPTGEPLFIERMNKVIPEWPGEVYERFFADFGLNDFLRYYRAAVAELNTVGTKEIFKNQSFYERYIASCLVDADHLKTADFMNGSERNESDAVITIAELNARNEESVRRQRAANVKQPDGANGQLNALRDKMSAESYAAADGDEQLLSMSVPTGGGKTLASLRFGLRRAVKKGLNRIVYIVPFTTVIEQNAASVRHVLGLTDNDFATVLEYHSTVTYEDDKSEKNDEFSDDRYHYARDTWDAPIIFTTQVAYLNALFGSGSRNLRHMHRLVKSVLVFDEIQSMPFKCVGMSNTAINWLTTAGGTTGLLCTATKPALEEDILSVPLLPAKEIVSDLPDVELAFKRVDIVNLLSETWTTADLVTRCESELKSVNSVLVVLNTKRAVKEAYTAFDVPKISKFHLSTAMCAEHRQEKFATINEQLKLARQKKGKVIVFSTKLIEAGVDLSFESVFRSCAGLDSIVQAAGRCNRNHELPMGHVYTFNMDGNVERLTSLPDISIGGQITKELAHTHPDADFLSSKIIHEYFRNLFTRINSNLNYPCTVRGLNRKKSLLKLFASIHDPITHLWHFPNEDSMSAYCKKLRKSKAPVKVQNFSAAIQTVAENFEPIASDTVSIIVQWPGNKRSEEIVAKLEAGNTDFDETSELLREAQKFTVQLYAKGPSGKRQLEEYAADYLDNFHVYVAKEGVYSDDFGLGGDGRLENIML